MQGLKRTKYSKSKSIEKRELGVLEKLFNATNLLTKLTRGDDDFPTIDGYLHLLNKEREITGQTLHVQIKPLKYKKVGCFSVCKLELLAYAYEASTPVLLIGVDSDKEIAYWTYLSPEMAASFFGKADHKKTTSITFSSKNVIKKEGPDYVEEWNRICLHHRNQSNDKIITKLIRKRKKEAIEKQISSASLEALDDLLFYRTNGGEYPFFDHALSLATEVCKRDENAKLRYMEVLERIYYHRTTDVLKVLFDLSLDETKIVAEKAKKILLQISKYNFHVLNSLGYGPHRLLVDATSGFMTRGGERSRSLSQEILQNIVNSSFEGTSNTDRNTITFHRGPLEATPYLQKIRQDATKILFKLFDTSGSTSEKTEILSVIFHVFDVSDHGFANEESEKRYIEMVNNEGEDVVKRYSKIAFPTPGELNKEYPLVYEIEHQMAWLKLWKRDVNGLDTFLTTLRTTKSDYSFYRNIFGEAHDINPDEGYEAAKKEKEEAIQKYLDSVDERSADEWRDRLVSVATFAENLKEKDFWKFNHFRDFLARIGKFKINAADRILSSTFDKKDALYSLAGNFLFGLRQGSIAIWDKYAKQIEEDESEELTKALLISFEFHPVPEVKEKVRPVDIDLLVKIVRCKDRFAFLKNTESRSFLYQCVRSTLYVYQADPKQCRVLIIELLKSHPEKSLFFDQLSFGLWAKWLTLEDWTREELGALANALVDVERLGNDEEQVLLKIGQCDFELIVEVFDRRLAMASRASNYDTAPHDSSRQELSQLIGSHPNYKKVLLRWMNNLTEEDAVGRIKWSELINYIGGSTLETVIQEKIVSGEKEDLKKVLALFPLTEAPDFRLCFQIIETTEDKKILRSVEGKMRNLGVLSGSYGDDLYGDGLKIIKERLEREGLTHENQRVRDFSSRMILDLEKDIVASAEQHKKRLEEDEEEDFEEI